MTTKMYEHYQQASKNGSISDDVNPIFLFSLTHVELLCKIAQGEIDVVTLAKIELANRGLNEEGRWVGFKK